MIKENEKFISTRMPVKKSWQWNQNLLVVIQLRTSILL
jgi:hypothetical protein